MATASAGNGNWHEAGTWTAGVPAADDVVTITHTVALVASQANVCLALILDGSGKLTAAAGATLTFTDSASAYFQIDSDALGFDSAGTAASPVILKSASANPTNPWYWAIADQTTIPDSRTMDFSYTEVQGSKWFLGNDTYYIHFNGGADTDPIITDTTPPVPSPRLVIHYCDGRDYPRVYQTGTESSAAIISGTVRWDSYMYQALVDMIRSKQRLSLITRWIHLPTCRIERPSFTPDQAMVKFSITLVEDK